ncbi:hypothetical protein EDC56_1524 [Sinobacterium caligoides]|uniref:Uncharacterized protein n=1 Tax=Sinobacterium caligoides TaxID=933926 RepID=A0A3N2DMS1_9GAMM|nr:hypothetical protein [Sinobacterium caligoides]ROS01098.1 hypothetical protein EDC56_1524 [Sinobacterium caligoides]
MLIRFGEELKELPDEIAIAILSDPSTDDDLSLMSTREINTIVHGCLGITTDNEEVFEDNIQVWKDFFFRSMGPDDRQEQAKVLLEKYRREISETEIGVIPIEDMF